MIKKRTLLESAVAGMLLFSGTASAGNMNKIPADEAIAETIAIIGTGNVGGALGKRWAAVGHTIVYGALDPADELFIDRDYSQGMKLGSELGHPIISGL